MTAWRLSLQRVSPARRSAHSPNIKKYSRSYRIPIGDPDPEPKSSYTLNIGGSTFDLLGSIFDAAGSILDRSVNSFDQHSVTSLSSEA